MDSIVLQEIKKKRPSRFAQRLLFTGGLVSNTIIHYTEGAGRTSGSFSLLKISTTA